MWLPARATAADEPGRCGVPRCRQPTRRSACGAMGGEGRGNGGDVWGRGEVVGGAVTGPGNLLRTARGTKPTRTSSPKVYNPPLTRYLGRAASPDSPRTAPNGSVPAASNIGAR